MRLAETICLGYQTNHPPPKQKIMKRRLFTVICFALVIEASSCGKAVENDAEEAASVACKLQTLISTTRFEDSMEERMKLEGEAKKLERELKQKYPTKESWKLFMAQYSVALKKCVAASFNKK